MGPQFKRHFLGRISRELAKSEPLFRLYLGDDFLSSAGP